MSEMRAELVIHPDFRCPAVHGIAARVERTGEATVWLAYSVAGDVGRLSLPERARPERTDELWRHTCFELFVKLAGGEGYLEFNFAPSGQWAAYRFSGYREGMAQLEIAMPEVVGHADESGFALNVRLDISGLDLTGARIALTAVIETVDGERSYWSLAHAPGRPDFHHPASFAADLPDAILALEP